MGMNLDNQKFEKKRKKKKTRRLRRKQGAVK